MIIKTLLDRTIYILFTTCLSFLCSTTFGDFTYSSLGPDNQFGAKAYGVGTFPDGVASNIHLGFQFTAEATGTLDSLDVAVWEVVPGQNDSMLFSVWSDFSGLPGEELWVGAINPNTFPGIQNVQVADLLGSQLLEAGETYWVSSRSNNGTAG